ncbi:hypothetical protein DFH07DRAFT_952406 [Mycena maculata]|uniref:Uncharacterized protein n=1 Tax=Mycena maculata TaxID=230809 RepID=A0AAD7NT72_9AGAR|nr:hypothetical protein DFH07DRAFT_952406 [Mycena maculata]
MRAKIRGMKTETRGEPYLGRDGARPVERWCASRSAHGWRCCTGKEQGADAGAARVEDITAFIVFHTRGAFHADVETHLPPPDVPPAPFLFSDSELNDMLRVPAQHPEWMGLGTVDARRFGEDGDAQEAAPREREEPRAAQSSADPRADVGAVPGSGKEQGADMPVLSASRISWRAQISAPTRARRAAVAASHPRLSWAGCTALHAGVEWRARMCEAEDRADDQRRAGRVLRDPRRSASHPGQIVSCVLRVLSMSSTYCTASNKLIFGYPGDDLSDTRKESFSPRKQADDPHIQHLRDTAAIERGSGTSADVASELMLLGRVGWGPHCVEEPPTICKTGRSAMAADCEYFLFGKSERFVAEMGEWGGTRRRP